METSAEIFIFASSSGNCTLKYPYCIVDPIAHLEPSLNYADFEFLIKTFNKKILFGLSGKGDFFASYKSSEKLLLKLLSEDVEIVLDINGVFIHEFGEIPNEYLSKILSINLTMHYQQLKSNNLLDRWKNNALKIIELKQHQLILGTILSPKVKDYWHEALEFYKKEIYIRTHQKILLIRDVQVLLSLEEESALKELKNDFAPMISNIQETDFSLPFRENKNVLCPAESTYFRVWNDGTFSGCPYIDLLKDMGNVKARNIKSRELLFPCNQPGFCDCDAINSLGKMIFI